MAGVRHVLFVVSFFVVGFVSFWSSLDDPLVFDSLYHITDKFVSRSFFDVPFEILWQPRLFIEWTYVSVVHVFGDGFWWQRLVNVGLHCANACWVYALSLWVFRRVGYVGWKHFFGAGLAALFFLWHPVGVYAVAYLIQRSILVALFFSLMSLWCFLRASEGQEIKKWFFLVLSVLSYFVAIHAKEHIVLMPVVMVLTLWFFGQDFKRTLRSLWWGLAVMVLMACELVFRMKGILGTVYEPYAREFLTVQHAPVEDLVASSFSPHFMSVVTQMGQFFRYLFIMLFPLNSQMAVDLPTAMAGSLVDSLYTVAVVAFLCIPFVLIKFLNFSYRKKLYPFLWAFLGFSVLFLVEFSTVRLHDVFVVYRSYLWVWIFVIAFAVICMRYRVTVVMLVGFCIYLISVQQNRLQTFSSPLVLWQDAVAHISAASHDAPSVYRPYANLGRAQVVAGQYRQAKESFEKSLEFNPKHALGWNGLGIAAFHLKDWSLAELSFKEAHVLKPGYAKNHYDLGVLYAVQGDDARAINSYLQSTQLDPGHYESFYNLANSYLRTKNYERALKAYQQAVSLRPDFPETYHNLGVLYLRFRDAKQAKAYFKKALEVDPDYGPSLKVLETGL